MINNLNDSTSQRYTKTQKTFHYKTITGRLRTVSTTVVLNLKCKGPTFPLPAMVAQSIGQTLKVVNYSNIVTEDQ